MNKFIPQRTTFLGIGDELNYLNDVLTYARKEGLLHDCQYAISLRRFEQLIHEGEKDDGSIMLQDHWALFHELMGKFDDAARCREVELQRIAQAEKAGGPSDAFDITFRREVMLNLLHDYTQTQNNEDANRVLAEMQQRNFLDTSEEQLR